VYGQQDLVDVGAHEPIAVGGARARAPLSACGQSIDTGSPAHRMSTLFGHQQSITIPSLIENLSYWK
jgi:hypothetical protein